MPNQTARNEIKFMRTKSNWIFLSLLILPHFSIAQSPHQNSDVASVDDLINALYDGISFKPGEMPDWDRLRRLFSPRARLIAPGRQDTIIVLSFEEFAANSSKYIDTSGMLMKGLRPYGSKTRTGFSEKEITRRIEEFGSIVHIWSTYESRHTPDDPEPFSRGINSIQLLNHGERWWIVMILWDVEQAGKPLPPKYLPKKEVGKRNPP